MNLMISEKTIEEIRQGSMKAFESFFNAYYPKVKAFAAGMLKDIDDAENVAQNVFMKIWIGRDSLSSQKSIENYVFTIVRNEVYDMFRATKTSTRYKDTVKKKVTADDGYEIDSDFNIKEIRKIVDDTIQSMPQQRRLIFTMSRRQYLTNDEIAERLSLSKRTVEKHISLALATIRERLGDFMMWVFLFFLS